MGTHESMDALERRLGRARAWAHEMQESRRRLLATVEAMEAEKASERERLNALAIAVHDLMRLLANDVAERLQSVYDEVDAGHDYPAELIEAARDEIEGMICEARDRIDVRLTARTPATVTASDAVSEPGRTRSPT